MVQWLISYWNTNSEMLKHLDADMQAAQPGAATVPATVHASQMRSKGEARDGGKGVSTHGMCFNCGEPCHLARLGRAEEVTRRVDDEDEKPSKQSVFDRLNPGQQSKFRKADGDQRGRRAEPRGDQRGRGAQDQRSRGAQEQRGRGAQYRDAKDGSRTKNQQAHARREFRNNFKTLTASQRNAVFAMTATLAEDNDPLDSGGDMGEEEGDYQSSSASGAKDAGAGRPTQVVEYSDNEEGVEE